MTTSGANATKSPLVAREGLEALEATWEVVGSMEAAEVVAAVMPHIQSISTEELVRTAQVLM